MNKTAIKEALMAEAGGSALVGKAEIKRCLGWGNERTDKLVAPLDYLTQGRKRQYLACEVASRVCEQMVVQSRRYR